MYIVHIVALMIHDKSSNFVQKRYKTFLWKKFIATKVSKLIYLIKLNKIYQMQPSLLKLDLAFKFYDSICPHFLDFQGL